ncbi:hypothetical protein Rhe02_29950 [Rhizocola hellebori]|uniref:Uncharacterized protein n=1 Tax=Rhizocola hellebori TaxID=1392758 RepID=A0A8J3Q7Z9_9ACTN|nr:hypothetical protein [Rhizocola hellebori]GIH04928.1 hypothetical protein Rhe02_29950 [Rhizocola hellebori]
MTTNEQITAAADDLAETIRNKMNEEFYHTYIVYQEHLWSRIESTATSARNAIVVYTVLNATDADGMLGSLRNIFGGSFGNPLADPARGYIDDVASYITDWYGTAAEAFRINFLNPYPEIRQNQIALVRELALAIEGYQAIVEETRAKVVAIANQGCAALNSIGTPLPVVLSVAAAFVGVVAAVATAPATIIGVSGALIAGGLAMLGGGLSVAGAVAGETPTPSEAIIQGGNVEEVVSSIYSALTLLRQDRDNAEAKLVAVLQHDLALVETARTLAAQREVNLFVPYQPGVIGVFSGEDVDFRLSTSGS